LISSVSVGWSGFKAPDRKHNYQQQNENQQDESPKWFVAGHEWILPIARA
jgi:hypothetical protein